MGGNEAIPADETLDVRTIDGEPFEQIMESLESLGQDESLLLINSFEPEPLYNVLEQRGYEYDTEQKVANEWHVEIQPAG
jgi:uncharacterized protein (DUF2249 family)